MKKKAVKMLVALLGTTVGGAAHAIYINVANLEGESEASAAVITYATLDHMLADTNRLGVFEPNPSGLGPNIVGIGSDGSTYWTAANFEGESDISAAIITYGSLAHMLADTNRLGVFQPNPSGLGPNIVGTGSDGTTYWTVANFEGESDISAAIITYASLAHMLADTNRLGVFEPNPSGLGPNVVGTGSDGTTYWTVANLEGESTDYAAVITYGSLAHMLADTNRLGVFEPNPSGLGPNLIGSAGLGFIDLPEVPVPEPATLGLLGIGLLGLALSTGKPRR